LHTSLLHLLLKNGDFLNTDILQGSVATRLGLSGVFIYDFVTDFLLSLTVKEFCTFLGIVTEPDDQRLLEDHTSPAARSDDTWMMALLIQLKHFQLPNDTAVSIPCGLLKELLESGVNPLAC